MSKHGQIIKKLVNVLCLDFIQTQSQYQNKRLNIQRTTIYNHTFVFH